MLSNTGFAGGKCEGVARRLGHLLAVGTPQRVLFPLRSAWVVPVQLAYPGCGVIGEVGMVVVDATTGEKEQAELDEIEQIEHIMTLLKAQARKQLSC